MTTQQIKLNLNIEAICTCGGLTGCLQAQSHCSCLFERFEGKAYSLCTRSVKVNQPAEEGWMLFMKLPLHRSLAWSWHMTYRTYMKNLKEPDGLTGPEAIPHCWWWICRSGWEVTREHTGWVPPAVVNAIWQLPPWGDLMVTHGKGLQIETKPLFGVQGLPPTHPPSSLSSHWICSWDNYPSNCAERSDEELLGVSFSAESTVAVFVTAPGVTVCLFGLHWRPTPLATSGGSYLSAEGTEE